MEFDDPNANSLDTIIDRFGTTFPKTVEFSDLARLTLPEVNAAEDPDLALVAWLNHEEALFRRLERRVVSERIAQGFGNGPETDVDGFLYFSLQVQNRRKSRMGRAFENHLEAVFKSTGVRYSSQGVTEHGNKPDFLFPGAAEYHELDWRGRLTMLAAKSSCKERWRQALAEADRIPDKHLITLEPAISTAQTDQMQQARLQLIVPTRIQETYRPEQRRWLWSLAQFIDLVRFREK